MFNSRFNPENAADFRSVIDAVNMMTGRAKSTLHMLSVYLEGDCDTLCSSDVANVIYGVMADIDDVDEVLDAHHEANFKLQNQIDMLKHVILSEKILTPEKLDLILSIAELPAEVKDEFVTEMRQAHEKTIH